MPTRQTPTGRPVFGNIPTTWSPYAAETIQNNFERVFKYVAGTQGATHGGTGLTSFAIGDVLYADTIATLARLADVATGNVLLSGGVNAAPAWGKVNLSGSTVHVTGTLPVTKGGTGLSTVTQGDLLYASAADTLTVLAKDTNATRYLSNTGTSNNPAWAQVDLSNGVTGTLTTANGGTGLTTYAAGDLLYYATGTALSKLAKATFTGQILQKSSGSPPQWGPVYPTTAALGRLIVGAGASSYSTLSPAASAGKFLRSITSSFLIEWSTLTLPNAANQGEIPYASAANVLSMLGVGTAGQVLVTNGAGANPSWGSLPAAAAGEWSVLTDGDATQPELIFAGGDAIMTFTP